MAKSITRENEVINHLMKISVDSCRFGSVWLGTHVIQSFLFPHNRTMNRNQLSRIIARPVDPLLCQLMVETFNGLLILAKPNERSTVVPHLVDFIADIAKSSRISSAVIYIAILYISRLKFKIAPNSTGILG